MRIYRSEQKVNMRLAILRRAGIWPGIIRCDGGWRLSYDPFLWELS